MAHELELARMDPPRFPPGGSDVTGAIARAWSLSIHRGRRDAELAIMALGRQGRSVIDERDRATSRRRIPMPSREAFDYDAQIRAARAEATRGRRPGVARVG